MLYHIVDGLALRGGEAAEAAYKHNNDNNTKHELVV